MKWLAIFWMALTVSCVWAETSYVSESFLAEQDSLWVLVVKAPQKDLEAKARNAYQKNNYLSPNDMGQLIALFMRDNISLQFNDREASMLNDPSVELGNEVRVVFTINDAPSSIYAISYTNNMFTNSRLEQSLYRLKKTGIPEEKYNLNYANAYTTKVKVLSNNIYLEKIDYESQRSLTDYWVFAGMIGFVIAMVSTYLAIAHKLN